jgi:hypothetical protein
MSAVTGKVKNSKFTLTIVFPPPQPYEEMQHSKILISACRVNLFAVYGSNKKQRLCRD